MRSGGSSVVEKAAEGDILAILSDREDSVANISVFVVTALVLAALSLVPAYGQTVAAKPRETSRPTKRAVNTDKIRRDVRMLLNDSDALPPEFAADVSITLVENGFVPDDTLKAKLLSNAFEKAGAAQDDVGRRPQGVDVEETAGGLHAIASAVTALDRTSLQARAIRQLGVTNPPKARRLFESMLPPQFSELSCNETWYFVPDSYYDGLLAVLQSAFSNHDIASGNRAVLVGSIIKATRSHAQVLPIARLLVSFEFTEAELRTIVPVYAATLAEMHGDSLSFNILMSDPRFFDNIAALLDSLDKHDMNSRAVLRALREYMVVNFKGSDCSTRGTANPKSPLPDAVAQFNTRFASRLKAANLEGIREDEVKSDRDSSAHQEAPLERWKSATYFQMLRAVQEVGLPPHQRADKEGNDVQWLSHAQDVLTKVTTWSNQSDPEIEFFHQKAILLGELTRRTNGTSLYAEAVDSFARFLEQNSYEDLTPIDWFFCVKTFIRHDLEPRDANPDLTRLVNSRNAVLSVYARLQLLLQSVKDHNAIKPSTSSGI